MDTTEQQLQYILNNGKDVVVKDQNKFKCPCGVCLKNNSHSKLLSHIKNNTKHKGFVLLFTSS